MKTFKEMKKDISLTFFIIQCLLAIGVITFYILGLCGIGKMWKFSDCFDASTYCLSAFTISLLVYILYFCKVRATKALQIYFILALCGHFIGGDLFNLYVLSKNYNYILHAFNSCMIGIIIYGMILRNVKKQSPIFMLIMTTASVVAVGVIWEFYEYLADTINGINMQRWRNSITGVPFVGQRALRDTMWDLFCDFFGGIFAGIFAYPVVIKGKSIYQHFELKMVNLNIHHTPIIYNELPLKSKQNDTSVKLQNQVEIDNLISDKLENQIEIEELVAEDNTEIIIEPADENKSGEGGEN
ncbi:MAG: hypothetical protein IKA36_00525 [Clostridia bacterium]|nr:hypothetical protein [Clostridia bacterium]